MRRAASSEISPLEVPDSLTLEMDFSISEIAHPCSCIPCVERGLSRTVRYSTDDYWEQMHMRIIWSSIAVGIVGKHYWSGSLYHEGGENVTQFL